MALFRRVQYWSIFWTEWTSPHCLPTTSGIILTLFSNLPLGPSFIFSNHNFVGICRFPDAWHKPHPFHPPWFYYWHRNKIWLKYKLLVFSLWTFVQPPVTPRFFIQTHSFELPVINTHEVYFLRVKDHILRPDILANNIPVSYVYINIYAVLCLASRYSE